MKLLMLTNMPSYHQLELGAAFAAEIGGENFRLVFENDTSDSRREMGWQDSDSAPYIVRYWSGEAAKAETQDWIDNADVVIQGRFPLNRLRQRIAQGKLTFCYQERFWKRRFAWYKVVLRLPRIIKRYWSVNRSNYHLLAAGAFVAPDLNALGVFRRRSWKFGYFIEASDSVPRKPKRDYIQLVWCARLFDVKRPELALDIVTALGEAGVDCRLTMIGDGELRSVIEQDVRDRSLQQQVVLTGWQSSERVKALMADSDALLMTSDFREGWALVINEAMNQACAVIASREIGAVPWLIQQRQTGFAFDAENLQELCQQISAAGREGLLLMGERAYQQHRAQWSAAAAAQRLLKLSSSLLQAGGELNHGPYDSGPCSPA